MLNILHLSDVHFGPPYVSKVGEAMIARAQEMNPDIIVVSGDFTQRAKREQFAAAREFLDALPRVPTIVTPGNHDVPMYRVLERVFSPFALYQEYISRQLDSVMRREDIVIVALNSTKPLEALTNGRIHRWQLDFAADAFQSAPENAFRVVVAHHHFAPAPDWEGGQVMPNAKRAMDRFTDLKVDLVMGGHLHRAYIGNSLDVYPGKDREHGIIIVQAGTATSRRGRAREREKNSFNFIRIADEIVRITHHMYFEDVGGFAPISRHIFPRSGRRYLVDGPALLTETEHPDCPRPTPRD
jgi:3',5'-cyclic AMP phosphodiesterase CpdA